MNESLKQSLIKTVRHVNFDDTERMLYSHDIGALPSLIKPLIGSTIPDAIVQPESETELAGLLSWADGNGITLTPRGKATSGYGGVLPVKGGVVVDFWRMKKVISIDEKDLTATVEPGVTWEKLDRALIKKGLTLCMYPSSYPAATVGGWLAQGGAGFGSYEFGYFRDVIVSAKAVLPGGEIKEFKGPDIDLIYEAEGITGIISEITIKVQPFEELDYCSFTCPDAAAVKNIADAIMKQGLPIWAMLFINPKMAEFKRIAPVREHHGHPAEEQANVPSGAFVMTLAFRISASEIVRKALDDILTCCDSRMLPQEIADHEWENRFRLMVVKRLGPSLAPVEVIVPLSTMPRVFDEINRKIGQPIVKEAVIIPDGRNGKPEVVILGFIPCDQRRFGYNFVFALALTVMKIAEKNGGRAYSTGFYFTSKARQVLGKERLAKMADFKKKVDPEGILNPEKVLGGGLLKLAMTIAPLFEPMTRRLGNAAKIHIGERPANKIKGIPPEVVWYAYSCSQCGYCVDECDQFYGRGWESQSPRGKWYWLRQYLEGKKKWDQKMVDTFIVCTTCEICNNRCSAALPIEQSWMKLRGKLIQDDKKMTFPPFAMMEKAALAEGDIWAGYRKDRDAWFPKDMTKKHGPGLKSKNAYFAGCTASYVENDIGIASVRLLDDAGVDFAYVGRTESCCGTPMLVAGKWDTFAKIMKDNIAAVKAMGADTVISSCPACDMMWRHVYPVWAKKLGMTYDITAKHYSEIVAEKIESGEFKFPEKLEAQTVTWHDSCHAGRVSGIYDPPRKLIEAIPNVKLVEMENNRECAHCCGSVLTLIKEPDVAALIGKDRLEEAVEAGAEKMLALCPCCEFQLRVSADKANSKIQVEDLAAFAAKALGHELPDPHPEVKAQWAVFDGMISLMTPKGFADQMGTMWPELINAMPLGMGHLMRFIGRRFPDILDMMKPVFPVLFPILLPTMMPKVMPLMLARVAAKVPMPDYMKEQMPTLMPRVMDELMPHMIGDVVPMVTGPMVEYLKKSRPSHTS
jgi:Fe-S oxidoreductase/FAD/FMN-containing dehydrogenase